MKKLFSLLTALLLVAVMAVPALAAVRIEAEDATFVGSNTQVFPDDGTEDDRLSGGLAVTHINFSFSTDSDPHYIRFEGLGDAAGQPGSYTLTIGALCFAEEGRLGVRVNGIDTTIALSISPDWETPILQTETIISLNGDGNDIIDIYVADAETEWIWFDYIELAVLPSVDNDDFEEAPATVGETPTESGVGTDDLVEAVPAQHETEAPPSVDANPKTGEPAIILIAISTLLGSGICFKALKKSKK